VTEEQTTPPEEQPTGAMGLAVVPPSTAPMLPLGPLDRAAFKRYVEDREYALGVLMEAAIRRTSPADWRLIQGNPYPQKGAVACILGMIGGYIPPPNKTRTWEEDEKGRYYRFVLESTIEVPGMGIRSMPINGTASSRDPFFAEKNEEITQEDGSVVRQKVLRPASEIDPNDIEKKALTNLMHGAIKRIFPSFGIEWLEKASGGKITRATIGQTWYGEEDEETRAKRAGGGAASSGNGGNCPSCKVGTLRERNRRDGSGTFWGCDKYPTCKHTQNDPPKAAAPATPEKPSAAPPTVNNGLAELREECERWLATVFDKRSERVKFLHETYQTSAVSALDRQRLEDCIAALKSLAEGEPTRSEQ
jgi:ssDNA-binding Zn-finger/Zn-ribbon topoisomerase 1